MIDEYLESKVTTATPFQLHLMVLDGALRHARTAETAMAQGKMAEARTALAEARRFAAELLSRSGCETAAGARSKSEVALCVRHSQSHQGGPSTRDEADQRFRHDPPDAPRNLVGPRGPTCADIGCSSPFRILGTVLLELVARSYAAGPAIVGGRTTGRSLPTGLLAAPIQRGTLAPMIPRILEPEVMDSPLEAVDYNTMDHSQVNRVFVDDLLSALPRATKLRRSRSVHDS